ncbi:superoxide dismutase family protein [Phenylobacterium montanum]|uniref:Superoxide dismutase [Cu-Zn] n=1 Tax=Phenylobacterium montanum TaxID=2823693 RepID=A0A975G055_9CAUL|nr:superoxide dismutase family protein [Caulobacter sp. S6]QUD88117.1 superoxide dismutase family protein [Caulobacter sp. S6]
MARLRPSRLALPALLAAAVCGAAAAQPAGSFTATIKTPDGANVGTAVLTEAPTGVLIRVEVKGLTPGWHGMHLHEKGDCSDAKFMNAGGHLQMSGMKMPHGLLAAGGPDDGDLPNLFVQPDGAAKAEAFSTRVTLKGAEGRTMLLGPTGSALMIHSSADDQTTQPIGGAGPRVACAVIRQ